MKNCQNFTLKIKYQISEWAVTRFLFIIYKIKEFRNGGSKKSIQKPEITDFNLMLSALDFAIIFFLSLSYRVWKAYSPQRHKLQTCNEIS